jgi:GT2 family glycosyltransferase
MIHVFVKTWNRPLHLWACLDSFYRLTRHPCRFVVIDNASTDPQTHDVIRGFERRDMFTAVHLMDRNARTNQDAVYAQYRAAVGDYVVLVDGDVVVEDVTPCWLGRMVDVADRHPRLAMLGSYLDTSDFVDLARARRLAPQLSDEALTFLVKADSPERRLPPPEAEIIRPFNPPGRFVLLRTAAVDALGLRSGGVRFWQAALAAGWDVGIATAVRHRHLSLCNLFDYPDYDVGERNRYFAPGPDAPDPARGAVPGPADAPRT